MSAIRAIRWTAGVPEIQTARLVLRIPRDDEVPKILRFVLRNREHTRRWEPHHPDEFFTESYWQPVPERSREEAKNEYAYRFRAVMPDDEQEFVANAVVRDIARGDWQYAQIGYTVDVGHTGRGYASEIVAALVEFAFDVLDLHRLEACHMLDNHASERVLQKNGFVREGVLRGSMLVNGQWTDHALVSRINPQWRGGRPRK